MVHRMFIRVPLNGVGWRPHKKLISKFIGGDPFAMSSAHTFGNLFARSFDTEARVWAAKSGGAFQCHRCGTQSFITDKRAGRKTVGLPGLTVMLALPSLAPDPAHAERGRDMVLSAYAAAIRERDRFFHSTVPCARP